jgi:HlyD family type I secretion membrane fusion protein
MAESSLHPSVLATLVVGEQRAEAELRRWNRIGVALLLGTVGVTLLWSTLAPLSAAVVAAGAVKVETDRKKIQHPDGGVVQQILVKSGSEVKAGDVLVRLDATQAGSGYGVVRGGRDITLATQARLEAERDQRSSIQWPEELRQRMTEPQVADTLRSQQAMFEARRSTLAGELSIIGEQIAALRNEITGYESQVRAKQEQLSSLQRDLDGLADLEARGMVEKTRVRAIQRDLSRLQGERDEVTARVAQARTAITEKELRRFQVRKAFSEDVAAELKKVQAEGFELLEREGAARRTLDLTELRAPVSGTVTDLKVHTPGGVVGAGEVLMEIVPNADRLIVEARVAPQDIDRVAIGLPAGVKLHAFNARVTPELDAVVSYVSADAVVDARSDTSHFTVRLEVPPEALARVGGDKKVMPGMQADVFIRTGERTFLGYLMQPLVDSFDKAWRER